MLDFDLIGGVKTFRRIKGHDVYNILGINDSCCYFGVHYALVIHTSQNAILNSSVKPCIQIVADQCEFILIDNLAYPIIIDTIFGEFLGWNIGKVSQKYKWLNCGELVYLLGKPIQCPYNYLCMPLREYYKPLREL